MCPNCWEDLPGVDELRLCPACLREITSIAFWDMIGDDQELLDFDDLMDHLYLGGLG